MFTNLTAEASPEFQPNTINQRLYINSKYAESTFEYIETALCSLNLAVSESSTGQLCSNQELQGVDKLLDYLCKDFLVNLPAVYSATMSSMLAAGGWMAGSDEAVGLSQSASQNQVTLMRQREIRYSQLFLQIVLSSFQIIESITKDDQFDLGNGVSPNSSKGIMACLPKVVSLLTTICS